MNQTQVIEDTRTVTVLNDADPIFTHVIDRGDDERNAQTLILEARVNGTPLTAICGHVWVPERDPQKYPVCPKCAELIGMALDLRGFNQDGSKQ